MFASRAGVFEPVQALGTEVRAGMMAGRVHNLLDPSDSPQALYFDADGIVFGRRHPGRVVPGNFTFVVMTDREDLDDQIWRTFVGCGVSDEKTPRASSMLTPVPPARSCGAS